MTAPVSTSLEQVFKQAQDFGRNTGRTPDTGHLLLAFFSFPNPAGALLGREGIDEEALLDLLEQPELAGSEPERPGTTEYLRQRAQQVALAAGSRNTGPLHLLGAIASLNVSRANRLLVAAGLSMGELRSLVLDWIELEKQGLLPPSATARPSAPPAARPAPPRPAPSVAGQAATPGEPPVPPAAPLPVRRPEPVALPPRTAPGAAPSAPPAGLTAATPPGAAAAEDPRLARWRLDPQQFPALAAFGRNLTALAAGGKIDPLVGREEEVEEVIDVLLKRRANNPCLIGEPGVGKTAIAEGLALRIVSGQVPAAMADRLLIGLDVGTLVSGTQLRGSFNERMAALREEVARAAGKVIVFIDEIHTMLGAGSTGDGSLDAAGELKQALAAGVFPCIGATTTDEYRKYVEADPALERRFQPVVVEEPAEEVAVAILRGLAPRYASHHQVHYTEEALQSAVRLSSRYITERFLPDKAINLLDLAGARARRQGLSEVGHPEIAGVVARLTEIPLEKLLSSEAERLLRMEDELGRAIIGHRRVLQRMCQTIRRNYAGFSSERPIGSFLFLGPTGVGKTETVKALADFLFQSREAMTRLDMSEYMEPHSVARMIGSPPGYVGHDEGGQLTEAVRRRPYQIVLLDEVEKAHRDVLNVLLQVLDDGRLTDGRGRTVDFRSTVVVMTSNLGSQHYGETRRAIGFGSRDRPLGELDEELAGRVLETAKSAFPIELWNRIEERLVFAPLGEAEVAQVAQLQLAQSSRRLQAERGISFVGDESAVRFLIAHGGFSRELGARPMRQTIQRLVEGPIAEQILAGRVQRGDRLRINADAEGKQLIIDRLVDPAPADSGTPPAAGAPPDSGPPRA